MRYEKDSIQISATRDVPILQQVMRSGFITHAQLFEFMRLGYCERLRQSFDKRLRRLLAHGFVQRHKGCLPGRHSVYSIGTCGALCLGGIGELYVDPPDELTKLKDQAAFMHAIELNEVQLALERARLLVSWIPEVEIKSQNGLTRFGYAKDYDAVVTVRLGEEDSRFALEYERTPKSYRQYLRIAKVLDSDMHVDRVLYLVPNHHMVSLVSQCLARTKLPVCIGLLDGFLIELLDTRVFSAGSLSAPLPLRDVLCAGMPSSRVHV